jgi:hypothetical protein
MKGNKKEQKDFAKEIGLFEAKVVAINPDREELEKLLGTELEKDPEYVEKRKVKDSQNVETGEEVDSVRISVWTEDVKSKRLRNISFYLEDRPRFNKDQTKVQYINSVGTTTWALIEDGTSTFPSWFTNFLSKDKSIIGNKEYRQAIVGEEELMTFVKNWAKFDLFDVDTNILLDTKKLFRGNVKELSEEINGDMVETIVAMATVRISEKVVNEDSGEKETVVYQSVYNKDFLPGFSMKYFRNIEFDAQRVNQLRSKSKLVGFEKFIVNISDKEYGCKTPIFIGEVKDFVQGEHITANDAVLEQDDAKY